MKFGTVFSGIEAPSVAWHPLGWEACWFSEIEKFPSALLAHHYPVVPNLGDMTKVKWEERYDSVDVVCGGSPCQAFSIAGLRKGVDDPRGNLTLEYLKVLDAVRPRWMVWENVPGVLSIAGGRTFGTFLGGLGQLGYGFAFRVLDAQYFGVPQRRRRVFVIGYLGNWRSAAAVLFEQKSLQRHFTPGRAARQVSPTLTKTGTHHDGDFHINGGLVPISFHWQSGFSDCGTENQCKTILKGQVQGCSISGRVRRFTPRECERLQGFPEDYTLIPIKKKLSSDDARYKALGNSMAVPVMRYLGERIQMVEDIIRQSSSPCSNN